MRTFDKRSITVAVSEMADISFDVSEWLSDVRNIALETDGDINLFEWQSPGVYEGHFFYKSRGSKALERAVKALEEIFSFPEVQAIRGLTPVDKLGAKWLSRKIGFRSFGEVDTEDGRCELFILTRQQYEEGKN